MPLIKLLLYWPLLALLQIPHQLDKKEIILRQPDRIEQEVFLRPNRGSKSLPEQG